MTLHAGLHTAAEHPSLRHITTHDITTLIKERKGNRGKSVLTSFAQRSRPVQGLPPSSPWTLSFIEPQITQFGGAQALRKAAKSAARRLRICLRAGVYRREGDPEQLITVNNQGPYKSMKRKPQDTAATTTFTLDPEAGPNGRECDCRRDGSVR
ncbi:hypothetical protein [Streptomyces sp. NBC_01236]|uniref:hypothetical protein n=1 Tax=Streptomyces sp. NBC_01236 TaxID=2903789 RepID=UPI002E146AD3|nr:hypothetical protein OG324_41585 [Streptomyces sp. NBC_01236]